MLGIAILSYFMGAGEINRIKAIYYNKAPEYYLNQVPHAYLQWFLAFPVTIWEQHHENLLTVLKNTKLKSYEIFEDDKHNKVVVALHSEKPSINLGGECVDCFSN